MSAKEAELIRELKHGSHKAFDRIYQMYARRLYAYSLQFTKSPADSEEIVQDVFVRLWLNREKIKQEETLCAMLFVMAKNLLINAFRSKINRPVFEDYLNFKNEISVNDTPNNLEYCDFLVQFQKALASLPPTQRKVIALSRIEDLTNKEIAKRLSLSEQTVKNQLSAGLKTLLHKIKRLYLIQEK
ncbi:MAG: RNA polymerase sigma-70 factor [Prevotellaceae bacterium]|jgi:RNA polymerase sigma-70 factor (ECF subfamily)|nr:RNA polymerase sigma-70 factor [Prevotellaceae bacterium]